MDQIMGLKFVYENIERFGGDREQIALIGCSSGGQSVTYHATNPSSHAYFKRSIILSAPTGIPYFEKDSAAEKYASIAASLECCNGRQATFY